MSLALMTSKVQLFSSINNKKFSFLGEDDSAQKQNWKITDKICCVTYINKAKTLVAGTKGGRLLFWKNMTKGTDAPSDANQ